MPINVKKEEEAEQKPGSSKSEKVSFLNLKKIFEFFLELEKILEFFFEPIQIFEFFVELEKIIEIIF